MTRRSLLLAFVALATAAAPASAVTGWTGPTLFGPIDSCREIAAGLDGNGRLHAAAQCGIPARIRYTTNASGSTVTTYFAHPSDQQDLNPEMAIEGNRIYVAFTRVDQGCAIASTGVYMRSRTIGGAWSAATMIAPAFRWLESLRVIGGKVHMTVFHEGIGRLQYRRNTTGVWQTFTIANDSFFGNSSLRIDSNGKARVAHATDAGIQYATFTGGSPAFSTVTVPQTDNFDAFPSLIIDGSNKAHIAFVHSPFVRSAAQDRGGCATATTGSTAAPQPRELSDGTHYVTNASGAFVTPTRLTAHKAVPSITMSPNGRLHVSVGGDTGLRYFTKLAAGAWVGTPLRSGSIDSSSVRLSPTNGRVYVTHIRTGDIWTFTKP